MSPAVLPVAPEEFERATRLLHQRTGIVVGERMLILVDIEKLMSSSEMALVEQALA